MIMYTIGHSTHEREEFLKILNKYQIKILVDVRSYPGSKFVPQFNKENMEKWILANEIKYVHLKELGGRRKAIDKIDESLVAGWENKAFRNYAKYSLTDEYDLGIDKLITLASQGCLCYMCAESVPWRCHRTIISNTLVSKGIEVYHIISEKKTILHELGKFGATPIVEKSKLIYPK